MKITNQQTQALKCKEYDIQTKTGVLYFMTSTSMAMSGGYGQEFGYKSKFKQNIAKQIQVTYKSVCVIPIFIS